MKHKICAGDSKIF